ncbi:hypothetical protein EGW08_022264 [Elysia chlorotica]|uniref:Uncharacterized protein n=1 Tax=Elysia chlorotica TaxID=188477 RepID=A0A433SLE9_ELYCH|nr:hypothetical protein EGW08_022264 [Elysia chlorotica]
MNSLVCLALLSLTAGAARAVGTAVEYAPLDGESYSKSRCVQIKDYGSCHGVPDGYYSVCDACHLGFYAACTDHQLSIEMCEEKHEHGNTVRHIFDSNTGTCAAESSSCPRQ